ncbi:MAG: hypothetical protein KDB14_33835 [Planctomycetales bacterium]|nr:hypothetical protein [Planctomycetales bacterium]
MARLNGKQSCTIDGLEFEVTLHEGRITSGDPKRRLIIVESPTPEFLKAIEAAVRSLVSFEKSDRAMPYFIDRLVLEVQADCTTNNGVTCYGSALLETDPPSTVSYDEHRLQDRSFFTFKTDSKGLELLQEKLNADGKCDVRFL